MAGRTGDPFRAPPGDPGPEYIRRVRRERGFGVNPWTTHSRFLVSQRLLIDESYVGPLRDWLGPFRSGSLLILDEAHHAAPSSGQRYAIDSHNTKAVRDLAPRFEHRLFLSATPHNGHRHSYSLSGRRGEQGLSLPVEDANNPYVNLYNITRPSL
jgi:hypothetical protein